MKINKAHTIISFFVAITIASATYAIYANSQFRLVRTLPSPTNINLGDRISFRFNKDVASVSSISSSTGSELSYSVIKNTISVYPKLGWDGSKPTTLTINGITSREGGYIDRVKVSFKARYISADRLSDEALKRDINNSNGGAGNLGSIETHFPRFTAMYDATLSFDKSGLPMLRVSPYVPDSRATDGVLRKEFYGLIVSDLRSYLRSSLGSGTVSISFDSVEMRSLYGDQITF